MELSFDHFDYTKNLNQQRALFKDCFPETNGEAIQGEGHYLWKFHSFPNQTPSWEYVSYIGSEMVGYYAAIPYQYKIGEEVTSVGMVCDVMTSSNHRGKGIFTRMGRYSTGELAKQVPFTMGYPIRKEVIPGHLKVGWEIPFSLPLYIKFIKSNSLLSQKKLGFLAPFANVLLSFYNGIVKTKYEKNYKYSIHTSINDIPAYDSFIKEWNGSVRNALIKDKSFANWRYNAPDCDYQFLTIQDSTNKLVGFVAFRKIIKEGVPSFGILDYMVLSGYEKSHGLINKVLVDYAKKEQVESLLVMMSKSSASKYRLTKNGFFKSPFVFQLIIKNLTNKFSNEELMDESNWHLMWVDSDDL